MDFEPYLETDNPPKISLPKGWPEFARVAILHVIALARLAIMHARCWPDGSENDTLRLRSEYDRLQCEVVMLRMELEIKDARIAAIDPHRRPNYSPRQRLQILRLRAARGWNKSQLARRFHVTVQTILNWMRALDDGDPLVGDYEEVKPTRYPDYIRMIIQQIKAFFPILGRGKIADMLGRASLHISQSTVGRIIKEEPIDPSSVEQPGDDPDEDSERARDDSDDEPPREIIAKYPNHIYSVDITEVPIGDGFWVPWSPYAIPQQWPFCWHVLSIVDHYSRRVIGFRVFHKQPTQQQVADAMTDMTAGVKPKHIVADRGVQFDCDIFHNWCRDNNVKWRHV